MHLEHLNFAVVVDVTTLTTNLAQKKPCSTIYHSSFSNYKDSNNFGYHGHGGHGKNSFHHGGGGWSFSTYTYTNRTLYQVYGKPSSIALKCYRQFDLSYQGTDNGVTPSPSSINQSSSPNHSHQAHQLVPGSLGLLIILLLIVPI